MILPLFLALQLAAPHPEVFDGRKGQVEARIPRIDDTVTVDGRLDEAAWRRAAILTGFSEYSPADQRPAPDSTEVLVWYSRTALYFGIRAYEPHGIVRATLADRDKISTDDNVEIHLDTFREGRRTVVFIVNPLGVQADGVKNEGGGFIPGVERLARPERPQRRLPVGLEGAPHGFRIRGRGPDPLFEPPVSGGTRAPVGTAVRPAHAAQRLRGDVDGGAQGVVELHRAGGGTSGHHRHRPRAGGGHQPRTDRRHRRHATGRRTRLDVHLEAATRRERAVGNRQQLTS